MNAFIRDAHVLSAMLVLLIMLFFAVSGFFLAHPTLSYKETQTVDKRITPPIWLTDKNEWEDKHIQYGLTLMLWLDENFDIRGVDYEFEWDSMDNLLIINLQSPSNNTLVEYFTTENIINVQQSPFSFLDTLNNVHRAKHTSTVWKYMSDVSAIIMLLFCLTGLWLALINKQTRKTSSQWFMVGASAFLLTLYLMH